MFFYYFFVKCPTDTGFTILKGFFCLLINAFLHSSLKDQTLTKIAI